MRARTGGGSGRTTCATFVTIGLTSGKTETWITDRTGHESSTTVTNTSRQARAAAELGLGPVHDLDVAIPEIAGLVTGGLEGGPRLMN